MAQVKIPIHIAGLLMKEQVSWAAGDPGAPYTAVEARNIVFDPTVNMIPVTTQKPEANRAQDAQLVGGKGGTLTFEIALRGGAGAESMFSKLAKNCGCDRVSRAGTAGAKVTGGSASTIVGLTADIGTYSVGDAIMLNDGGVYQIRMVQSIADATPTAPDTTITVFPNFATAPGGGEDLAQIDTIRPAADSGEPTAYLTFKAYKGSGAADRRLYTLTGCAGKFKINTTEAGGEPVVEFSFQVDEWVPTEASTTTTADAYNPAHPLLGDACYVNDTATAIGSFAFDPVMTLQPCVSTQGAQGRDGFLYPGVSAPKPEIVPYSDIDWLTRWTGGTEFHLGFESIKDADEAWAFFAFACQAINITHDDVGNEIESSTPDIQVNDPGTQLDEAAVVNLPLWGIGITGV